MMAPPREARETFIPPPFPVAPTPLPPAKPKKDKSKVLATGGSFLIVAGIIGLITPLLFFSVFSPAGILYQFYSSLGGYILLGFVLPLFFSTAALVGGFCALQKKYYSFVIIGGLLGILCWGFWLSTILSIIGLCLVLASSEEFGGETSRL
ncbi:MAG: hypothetical protein AB1485_01740 [Candidatus Thermoplasmatota archaeon]